MGEADQYCCYSMGQLYQCRALLPDHEACHRLEHVGAAILLSQRSSDR